MEDIIILAGDHAHGTNALHLLITSIFNMVLETLQKCLYWHE